MLCLVANLYLNPSHRGKQWAKKFYAEYSIFHKRIYRLEALELNEESWEKLKKTQVYSENMQAKLEDSDIRRGAKLLCLSPRYYNVTWIRINHFMGTGHIKMWGRIKERDT